MRDAWSRTDKLTAIAVAVGIVAAAAAVMVVPEFRRTFHLDQQEPTANQNRLPIPSSTPASANPTTLPHQQPRVKEVRPSDQTSDAQAQADRAQYGGPSDKEDREPQIVSALAKCLSILMKRILAVDF